MADKLTHEDFFKKAILQLRDISHSAGIHSVFSGFNQAFRDYFNEDPIRVTQDLATKGIIEVRPVKRGVMLYLRGEAPESRAEIGKKALSKILGTSEPQQALAAQFLASRESKKSFPVDFVDPARNSFNPITLPGTRLQLLSGTQATLVSPQRQFRYEAKNPSIAKFILYGCQTGQQEILVPNDNMIVLRAVAEYERYCRGVREQALSFFLSKTSDEKLSEQLAKEVALNLDLRA